ncbi:COX15/CtaA family protein [Microbacterium istanbulense]|uniref:COX15/CtaA family protein n=1 Tax=Microbacterium istanbulense TaxID=3122049 RepID=A0ABU8LLY0_9MICO
MPETTTTSHPTADASTASRSWGWMPTSIDRRIRVLAWLSFLAEVIIIGTGGAVRLTGSGLGCSEWPLCTPESLVPIFADQGIHGVIEFGNRTMTGLVGLLAIAVLLFTLHAVGGRRSVTQALWFALAGIVAGAVAFGIASIAGLPAFVFFSAVLLLCVIFAGVQSVRSLPGRKDLPALAWITLVGVIAQAFVGGITVLTGLNPFIVGFHYTASLLLVCVTAAFLVRMHTVPGPRERVVPRWFAILTHVTGLALAMTIVAGVLTTGSGPHSGDANVLRDGFDATIMAHVHSWPGYVLATLVAVLAVAAWVLRLEPRRWLLALALVVIVQVAVGVWQAREGLPPVLVGIHMVLASLAAAAYTVVVLRLKRPVASPYAQSTSDARDAAA